MPAEILRKQEVRVEDLVPHLTGDHVVETESKDIGAPHVGVMNVHRYLPGSQVARKGSQLNRGHVCQGERH